MYTVAYSEPSETSMIEFLCENHKKLHYRDVQKGSKYVSGINFMIEKVCRIAQVTLIDP